MDRPSMLACSPRVGYELVHASTAQESQSTHALPIARTATTHTSRFAKPSAHLARFALEVSAESMSSLERFDAAGLGREAAKKTGAGVAAASGAL